MNPILDCNYTINYFLPHPHVYVSSKMSDSTDPTTSISRIFCKNFFGQCVKFCIWFTHYMQVHASCSFSVYFIHPTLSFCFRYKVKPRQGPRMLQNRFSTKSWLRYRVDLLFFRVKYCDWVKKYGFKSFECNFWRSQSWIRSFLNSRYLCGPDVNSKTNTNSIRFGYWYNICNA